MAKRTSELRFAQLLAIAPNVTARSLHLNLPPMVSKCANPSCGTDFKYFREGRIYEFAIGGEGACSTATEAPGKGFKRELFWLCQNCAQLFTLECANGKITVVGREHKAA